MESARSPASGDRLQEVDSGDHRLDPVGDVDDGHDLVVEHEGEFAGGFGDVGRIVGLDHRGTAGPVEPGQELVIGGGLRQRPLGVDGQPPAQRGLVLLRGAGEPVGPGHEIFHFIPLTQQG